MKESDRKEVLRMLTDAVNSVVGDLAAYINYYSDRLEVLEKIHGVEVEGYGEFVEHYGTREKVERTIIVKLKSKGHHVID